MDIVSSKSAPYPFRFDATPSIRRASRLVLIDGPLGYIHPSFAVTHDSNSFGVQDGSLVTFAPNQPRWVDWPSGGRGLLLERESTNFLRNPRIEGYTPGIYPTNAAASAAVPTYFGFGNMPSGVTATVHRRLNLGSGIIRDMRVHTGISS